MNNSTPVSLTVAPTAREVIEKAGGEIRFRAMAKAGARTVFNRGVSGGIKTERICPDCRVERADYEGPNGAWLPKCPNCGSTADPVEPTLPSPTEGVVSAQLEVAEAWAFIKRYIQFTEQLWQADHDTTVGKRLIALSGGLRGYCPELDAALEQINALDVTVSEGSSDASRGEMGSHGTSGDSQAKAVTD